MKPACLLCWTLALATTMSSAADDPLTRPILHGDAANWNREQTPLRIYGDTYYVGVHGLSSVLIHGKQGSILLDGDLPQSVALIEAHIRTLGFDVKDIRFILNSHAHYDHAGGIAALQRDSGAEVLASPPGAEALRTGKVVADDPQAGFDDNGFPAAARVRAVRDGEVVRVGDLAVTAHFTPGHTPGSTTWTWKSCENDRCLDVVYADSLTAVAAPGFHFTADKTHGDLTARFRDSIHKVAALPCDILISTHPDASGADKKLEALAAKPATNPFIDAASCREYAANAEKMLDQRIAKENAER